MGVRESRLRSEYKAMQEFRTRVVAWQTIGNNDPPDVYHFTYKLKSIVGFKKNGTPTYHTGFKVEIRFPPNYPRSKPDVRLINKPWPVHPNIWVDGRFCLEGTQHWIPGIGVSLDSICQMVGEIIAFQEVYLGSPANNDAILKSWVQKNLKFQGIASVTNPVDPTPIRLPDVQDAIRWGSDKPAERRGPRIRFG